MNIASILNAYRNTPLITEENVREMFHGFNALLEQIPDTEVAEAIYANADEFLLSVITPNHLGVFSYLSGTKHITTFMVSGAEKLFNIGHPGIVTEMYLYLHSDSFVLVLDENLDEKNRKVSDLSKLFKGKTEVSGNTVFIPLEELM